MVGGLARLYIYYLHWMYWVRSTIRDNWNMCITKPYEGGMTLKTPIKKSNRSIVWVIGLTLVIHLGFHLALLLAAISANKGGRR